MLDTIKRLIPIKLKNKIKKIIKKKDFKDFKKQAIVLTQQELVKGFQKAGIRQGDVLFVHSSLKGLGYIENGPQTIIDALKEVIGTEGTLIFPVFTLDNSMEETLLHSDHTFDPKSSPSTVGSISNTFLSNTDVHRSLHPTHSVAAWGKHAKKIVSKHHLAQTNFGEDTPFGFFLELNGKLMGLGINYANITFYHTYEDLNLDLFPQVYLPKPIKANIKDYNNQHLSLDILCHNPVFHQTRIEKDPKVEAFFANYFEDNNISKKTKIGQGHIWWMHSQDIIKALEKLYKENITIYNIK